MLELAAGLTQSDLTAIAELERRVVDADGGRLKLEWGVLNGRSGERVEDLLWRDGDELLGFLGLYAFGHESVELAGMVDPVARRRGIATQLLDGALPLIREREYGQALLVCPRVTGSGAKLALSRGATLHHSEHALVLSGDPADGPTDPAVTLRSATDADAAEIARLLFAGFGFVPGDVRQLLATDRAQHLVIERDNAAIGYVRLTLDDDRGGVYGFVIDPALQGRGIGRDVLRRCCRALREQGAQRVGLEVAVDNERALGLYTSLGFQQVITEDYFRLPLD